MGKLCDGFWFFAHACMCMAGTPTEDAYRHGHMVAVAILEVYGGVRQDNTEVCQTPMLCSHRITDRIRRDHLPESELLENLVWVFRTCCIDTLIASNTRTPARCYGRASSFRHGALSATRTCQQSQRRHSGAFLCARACANARVLHCDLGTSFRDSGTGNGPERCLHASSWNDFSSWFDFLR